MPLFNANIDLDNNQLQNAVVHSGSSKPGSPATGQIFYDTDSNQIQVYTGSDWEGLVTETKDSTTITDVTSILNTSLVVGRDSTDQIKFSTNNQIIFRVDGGDGVTFKGSGEIEATSLDISGDADIGDDLLLSSSGAIINFNSGDMTITHSSNTLTVAGGTFATAALTASTGTFSGILKTDDTTDATSTTDGALQTDGGLSVAKDAVIGDDLMLLSDSAILSFGANKEVQLKHDHNSGLILQHTATADGAGTVFTISSAEAALTANEEIGAIAFDPSDSDGTDGTAVSARIAAVAEGTFAADNNATRLEFQLGQSEAASTDTARMTLSSAGLLTITDDLVIKNGGTIGAANDTDLLTMGNGILTVAGEVSMTTLDIGGTNVSATAAELNILDGVTATASELNIMDGVTSTTAELNVLDGITAVVGELNALDIGSTAVGTAVASKAVILDSNKDYTGIRNLTITGNLSVTGTTTTVDTVTMNAQNAVVFEGATADSHETTLTIVDPTADHTYYLPDLGSTGDTGYIAAFAADVGTSGLITSTPAELNKLDGATVTTAEINILDGVTSTAAELNILDGVTSTTAELNILDGVTATAAEINIIDGNTSATSTTLANADRVIVNDNGTMVQVAMTDVATYTNGSIESTGALDGGSITAGFGAIDNGTSGIRTATFTAETAFVPDASDGATLGTASLEFSDLYLADGAQILFGDDQEIAITHNADKGLTLSHEADGAAKPFILTLESEEDAIAADDVIAGIEFKATDTGGTDAILPAAGIFAVADAAFDASNNRTNLVFTTGLSETAGTGSGSLDGVTNDMELGPTGILTVAGKILTNDTTDATSTTDGSLQTDGGLSVAKDAIIGDDLYLLSDSAVLGLGAGKDATFTHDGTTGLTIAANPITLDSGADIVFDAAGNDFNFKAGGTEVLRITNSSSDVIIRPVVDAKDLIFQQRDGTEVARVEDNGTFNVVTGKLAINGTAISSTAAELNILDGVTATASEINLIDGGTARGTTAVADGDGILTNDGGTMRMTKVETFATYFAAECAALREKTFVLNNSTSGVASSDNITYTVTHSLNSRNVMVEVYRNGENSGDYQTVYTDIKRTGDDTITVVFGSARTAGDYTCMIRKIG